MKGRIITAGLLVIALFAEAQNIPQMRRIEGQGNNGLVIDLVPGMHDSILNSPNHKYAYPLYDFDAGPVKIDVFNPSLTPGGNYCIYFSSVNPSIAKWTLVHYGTPNDTVFGDSTVSAAYTQIIPQWGMSVFAGPVSQPGNSTVNNNGFLEATMTFSNSNHWLTGIGDVNDTSSFNWIKAGIGSNSTADSAAYYETVLGGTWSPYLLARSPNISNPPGNLTPAWNQFQTLSTMDKLASVDIVITSNQNKWTRCPVLEAGPKAADNIGWARHMDRRCSRSVDKNGQVGDSIVTNNPNDADYISANGMGWFPGYAINVETGERLNMAFAEASRFPGDNGADMIWNPTSNIVNAQGDTVFGGNHFIYVFGNNSTQPNLSFSFDNGGRADTLLQPLSFSPYMGPSYANKRTIFQNAMWVNAPLLAQGQQLLSNDVTIRLRVTKPYKTYATNGINNGNPMYRFNSVTLMSTPEETGIPTLGLYPNPVEDEITVGGVNGRFEYHIIDMMGRIVMAGISEGDKVHAGQLKRGIYVIRVSHKNSVYTLKFTRK